MGGNCPGGCSSNFIQRGDENVAQVRVISASDKDAATLLKNVEVNVQKATVDKDLMALVKEFEAKRNSQEQTMLESALHSAPTSFISKNELPFDVRIGVGSKEFPSFYKAVREMEKLRDVSEQRIRAELLSLLGEH